MTDLENEKELTRLSTLEHFHTAARLRELETEATTPWVKRYLRSLIVERERMETTDIRTQFTPGA